jgi:transcription-repair coupling factor (superfamily II helicase)
MVEERGEVSVRGGIVDLFPPVCNGSIKRWPVRVEFFGDEVESIRTFDPSTQRSQRELIEALILPAMEADLSKDARALAREKLLERADELSIEREVWDPLYNRLRDGVELSGMDALLPFFYEKLDTVFDYLPEETVAVVIDPPGVERSIDEFSLEIERKSAPGESFVKPEEFYLRADLINKTLESFPVVQMEPLRGEGMEVPTSSNLALRQDIALKKDLSPLADRVNEWLESGLRVYVTAHNRGQAERTKELLEGYGFTPGIINSVSILEEAEKTRGSLDIAQGVLSGGFVLPSRSLVIVTEEEVFGERVKRRPPPSKKLDTFLAELQDLKEGDFIVHAQHGIGLYRGLKRLRFDAVDNDFLFVEYRDGDKLYLPVQRMDLVTKYHAFEGQAPTIDKLGGAGWERAKTRVRRAVERIAGELIKLYAQRKLAEGFAFSRPGRLFTEFEESFEFEETPDQTRAIDEVMGDMEDGKPMDRLICGDVGYGKTEVAMRAAFRAVLDSKQVAMLVPTTVLAQQHEITFKERFAPFPVTVEALSRFKSRKEQKETIEKLKDGKVDILIGTHRLLQRDVQFKDLGLLIIDEEHRFGVRHKERLKELKKEVDVLTLTATPIPRTLQMSLTGIRDLSIINTPPEDRLAIATRVVGFDEQVMTEALKRELKRGGQVFFVHNRVESIGPMHEFLGRLVPEARIAVAHGQMREGELEKVMLDFVKGLYDILLTTTIIESGLDIPTANTIIINRSDRFGLADLYQLRGRVGRSSHRAYAYLVCPDEVRITNEARKRMEVIRELTELGSGFRVAAYDLEIRGAGELLGSAQSGHIALVGGARNTYQGIPVHTRGIRAGHQAEAQFLQEARIRGDRRRAREDGRGDGRPVRGLAAPRREPLRGREAQASTQGVEGKGVNAEGHAPLPCL